MDQARQVLDRHGEDWVVHLQADWARLAAVRLVRAVAGAFGRSRPERGSIWTLEMFQLAFSMQRDHPSALSLDLL